jgi:hypothetical protein
MRKRAWLVAAVVLSLGTGFGTGWVIRGSPATVASSATASATISGTFVVVGGRTTSPTPLTGCVSVELVTTAGAARCYVPVGSDGTWSVAVKPGLYAVFASSPMFNKTCVPRTNPVKVRAGAHVVVEIDCFID